MATITIDTSIWIALYRDRTGAVSRCLAEAVAREDVAFAPFVLTEVLQGARSDAEWSALAIEMARYPRLDVMPSLWEASARIYAELRWKGFTISSTNDCFIAQMSLDHDLTLLHNDSDFEVIAQIRRLKHRRLDLTKA